MDQELPQCHRHPHLLCPGECQYQLGPDDCFHDRPEEPEEAGATNFSGFCDAIIKLLARPLRYKEAVRAKHAYSLRLTPQVFVDLLVRNPSR